VGKLHSSGFEYDHIIKRRSISSLRNCVRLHGSRTLTALTSQNIESNQKGGAVKAERGTPPASSPPLCSSSRHTPSAVAPGSFLASAADWDGDIGRDVAPTVTDLEWEG
jgi:hypothetical protein